MKLNPVILIFLTLLLFSFTIAVLSTMIYFDFTNSFVLEHELLHRQVSQTFDLNCSTNYTRNYLGFIEKGVTYTYLPDNMSQGDYYLWQLEQSSIENYGYQTHSAGQSTLFAMLILGNLLINAVVYTQVGAILLK